MKLRIEKAIYGGDGLARIPAGKTVFVPATLPGELVEAHIAEDRRGFANGQLDVILEPSTAAGRCRAASMFPVAAAASTSMQTPPSSCR